MDRKGKTVSQMLGHKGDDGRPLATPAMSTLMLARQHGEPPVWGPEVWPEAVRQNVENWPPTFRERQLLGAVRAPLNGPRRIAIVSNKDGVGKSTTARILQAIFSACRTERSVVVDANPDQRGQYIHPEQAGTIRGVVERVGAGETPIVAPPPGDSDYPGLIRLLDTPFPIVLCDIASTLHEDVTRLILDECNQLVVVATPAVDGLYAASACLDDLRLAGYGWLADNAVCAINRIRPMPFSDLLTIDRHFSRRCREVVRIPWDARVGQRLSASLDELRPTTRTGFFELAAAVARSFGDSHATTPDKGEEDRR